jgi:hypothetical protein
MNRRHAPILLTSTSAMLLLTSVACAPGTYAPGDDDDTGATPDAATTVQIDSGTLSNADAAITANCEQPVQTNASGEHNAGQPCMPCHAAGGGGPIFTIGGTVYTTKLGGTPVVGGTIIAKDANGATIKLISAQNGNFWTNQAVAFPITVSASRCPDTQPMLSPVNLEGGNCNAAGCHTPQTATGYVHLP